MLLSATSAQFALSAEVIPGTLCTLEASTNPTSTSVRVPLLTTNVTASPFFFTDSQVERLAKVLSDSEMNGTAGERMSGGQKPAFSIGLFRPDLLENRSRESSPGWGQSHSHGTGWWGGRKTPEEDPTRKANTGSWLFCSGQNRSGKWPIPTGILLCI